MINHSKRLAIGVAAIYLLLPTLSLAVCPNLKGLYEKRRELRKKYERAFGENREMRDMYMEQIQAIDRKYGAVIYEMFFEHEKKEYNTFSKCCVSPIKDGFLFFVCKLIKYYRDGNTKSFLEDMPLGKERYEDLWEIDNIIFKEDYYSKPHPKLFDKGSFVLLFLDGIYDLAVNGNARAIDKYLSINSFADGYMAEYMADRIVKLFENHLNVISNNWKVIRKYKSTISFETTDYKYKADSLIGKYRDLFEKNKTDSLVSKEILGFLREKAE